MLSLRSLAECKDITGTFQVVRDFFGHQTGAPQELSLFRQLQLVRQWHVDINVILVGSESFGWDEQAEIDGAIAYMREAYGSVDYGVGRVRWFGIPLQDANGHEHIADDGEAKDLTQEWSVSNYALDVFFVLTYAGSTIGEAPRKGPDSKDAWGAMTGVVLAIEGTSFDTGQVLAREVCRYLGLKDSENSNNLMYPTVPNGGNLTNPQGEEMVSTGGTYANYYTVFPCIKNYDVVLTGGHW